MRFHTMVLATMAAVFMLPAACTAQPARSAPTQFYISTDVLRGAGTALSDEAVQTPGISGIFVRFSWKAMNPAAGKYDFSEVDAVVKQALRTRKALSIGVVAGDTAPDWLAQSGVPFADVQVVKRGCVTSRVAAAWSDAYVSAYLRMMRDFKEHLVRVGGFDAVRIVKLSGVTKRTLELSLPNNNRCSDTVDEQLAQIGYRPSRQLAAWDKMATGVAALFPGRLIAQPILQVQGFPAIDDNGRSVDRRQVTVGSRIIDQCIKDFGARCAVQWNGLNLTGKLAQRVLDAKQRGATIGWQTNLFEGPKVGAGCQTDRNAATVSCTPDTYARLLRRGVGTGASFIEVWEPDVLRYPKAFDRANEG